MNINGTSHKSLLDRKYRKDKSHYRALVFLQWRGLSIDQWQEPIRNFDRDLFWKDDYQVTLQMLPSDISPCTQPSEEKTLNLVFPCTRPLVAVGELAAFLTVITRGLVVFMFIDVKKHYAAPMNKPEIVRLLAGPCSGRGHRTAKGATTENTSQGPIIS